MNGPIGEAFASGIWLGVGDRVAAASRRASGQIAIGHCKISPRRGPSSWPFVRGLTTLFDAVRVGNAVRSWVEGLERRGFDEPRLDATRFTSAAVLEPIDTPKLTLGQLLSVFAAAAFLAALPVFAASALARFLGLDRSLGSPAFQALIVVSTVLPLRIYIQAIARLSGVEQAVRYANVLFKAMWLVEAEPPSAEADPLTTQLAQQPGVHPRGSGAFLHSLILSAWSVAALETAHALGTPWQSDGQLILLRLLVWPLVVATSYEAHLLLRHCYGVPVVGAAIRAALRVSRFKSAEPTIDDLEVGASVLRQLRS